MASGMSVFGVSTDTVNHKILSLSLLLSPPCRQFRQFFMWSTRELMTPSDSSSSMEWGSFTNTYGEKLGKNCLDWELHATCPSIHLFGLRREHSDWEMATLWYRNGGSRVTSITGLQERALLILERSAIPLNVSNRKEFSRLLFKIIISRQALWFRSPEGE